MSRVYIIAEAGVNHNGDYDLAKELILAAKKAGVDAVKFQTFVAKNLVSAIAPKAEYQKQTTDQVETQLTMLEKLELSFEQFTKLKAFAKETGIEFISTPFDFESIEFLQSMDMPFWKIPSGEITNKPYLEKIAQTKLPIILSTGMCTMAEIQEALDIFHQYDKDMLTLLHCNTEYPTPFEDVNLKAMKHIEKTFGIKTGYSDHTVGIEVAIAAVALGACVIEKHFTLDKNMTGPDHKASLEPWELTQMVKAIRNIEQALGTEEKKPSLSESRNISIARKSIVAKEMIHKGELFTTDNLTTKRPGDGISPMKWDEIVGLVAKRDFSQDEKIEI